MNLPLVFVPGMMCDARLFMPQIVALSNRHPITIAPITRNSDIGSMAATLLAAAPKRFALVGADMGGMVAMEVLRQAPERVDRVCLIGTTPLPETPDEAADREPLIISAKAGNFAKVLEEALCPDALAPGVQRIEIMDQLKTMAAELGPDVFERQCRALQRRRDQQRTLRKSNVPVHLVCGYHDAVTPVRRHETMAELIPHAQLTVVDGAGHIPTLEAPEQMAGILSGWLDQPHVLR
jgi:pimeloyl-ACP methyl ester carboxylesterase